MVNYRFRWPLSAPHPAPTSYSAELLLRINETKDKGILLTRFIARFNPLLYICYYIITLSSIRFSSFFHISSIFKIPLEINLESPRNSLLHFSPNNLCGNNLESLDELRNEKKPSEGGGGRIEFQATKL